MDNSLARIIIKGGVLSPAELKHIVECAENLGLNAISFGSRQDILFPVEIENKDLDKLEKLTIIKPGQEGMENIISSYVSSDIFPGTRWLTSGKYLYILEQLRHKPYSRRNIVEHK